MSTKPQDDFTKFKSHVKEYVVLDDKLGSYKDNLARDRKRFSSLKQEIMSYMDKNEIDECDILGGTETLFYEKKEKKLPPKKVKEIKAKVTKDNSKRDEAVNKLAMLLESHEKAVAAYLICFPHAFDEPEVVEEILQEEAKEESGALDENREPTYTYSLKRKQTAEGKRKMREILANLDV